MWKLNGLKYCVLVLFLGMGARATEGSPATLIFEDPDGHRGTKAFRSRNRDLDVLSAKLKADENPCELIDELFNERKKWTCSRETGWENFDLSIKAALQKSNWFQTEGISKCDLNSIEAQTELKKAMEEPYNFRRLLEVARKYPFRKQGVTAAYLYFQIQLEFGEYIPASWGLEELVQRLDQSKILKEQFVKTSTDAWAKLLFRTSLALKRAGSQRAAENYFKMLEAALADKSVQKLQIGSLHAYTLEELRKEWNREVEFAESPAKKWAQRFLKPEISKSEAIKKGHGFEQIDADTELYEYFLQNAPQRVQEFNDEHVKEGVHIEVKLNLDYDMRCAEWSRLKVPITGLRYTVEQNMDDDPDSALKYLKQLSELKTIELVSTKTTNEGLKYVKDLHNLKSLDLTLSKVTDQGLVYLKGLKGLTHLKLSHTVITDEGLKELRGLTELKSLSLANTKITDAGLAELANFENLEVLDLYLTHVTDLGIEKLKGLKNLKSLRLTKSQISNQALRNLRELKNLNDLALASTKVGDEGLQILSEFRSLKRLVLRDTEVTDEGLRFLRNLDLVSLDLDQTLISDKGVAHLKGLKRLQDLDLTDTVITDEALAHLSTCLNLNKLTLRKTSLTDASLKSLLQLRNLRELDIRETQISAQSVSQLKQAFPKLRVDK